MVSNQVLFMFLVPILLLMPPIKMAERLIGTD
jgi:hypothetical protein